GQVQQARVRQDDKTNVIIKFQNARTHRLMVLSREKLSRRSISKLTNPSLSLVGPVIRWRKV
ncbi:Hypothetical protein FKW44_010645, partial [Caligus rogercresseyi]